MNPLLTTVTATVILIAAVPAMAQDGQGLYLGGFAGGNYLMDADVEVGGSSVGDAEFSTGYAVGGVVGYRFFDDFRGEVELSYREQDIDRLFSAPVSGDVNSWALMANGYYDFPDIGGRLSPTVRPYLGGGLGAALVAWNDVIAGATPITDDDEFIVAFQAATGVGFGFTDNITLSLDYRFFATPRVELDQTGGSGKFEVENLNHTVAVGVRFSF